MTDGQRRWFEQDDKGAKAVTSPDFTVKCLDDVRAFLGLVNWYSPFLPKLNIALAALREWMSDAARVTKDGLPLPACQSIRDVQKLIAQAQPIWLPVPGRPFFIASDASDVGLSGVLLQMHPVDDDTLPEVQEALAAGRAEVGEDGKTYLPRPVAYWSQPTSYFSKNLNVTEREALAALLSVLTWKEELQGSRVVIFTDHANLQYLFDSSNLIVRRAAMQMLAFLHPEFVHIAGKNNQLADFISRYPNLAHPTGPPAARLEATRPTTDQLQQVAATIGGGVAAPVALLAAVTSDSSSSPPTSSSCSLEGPLDLLSLDIASLLDLLSLPSLAPSVFTPAEAKLQVDAPTSAEGKDIKLLHSSLVPVRATVSVRLGRFDSIIGVVRPQREVAAPISSTAPNGTRSNSKRARSSIEATRHTAEGDIPFDDDEEAEQHVAHSRQALKDELTPTSSEEHILTQLYHMQSSILEILQSYAKEDAAWAKAEHPSATIVPWAGFNLYAIPMDGKQVLAVPSNDMSLKFRILALCHEDSGHCGIRQAKINAAGFTWKDKDKEIAGYINSCPQCQVARPPGKHQMYGMMLLHPTPVPGEWIYIDLVGPFPSVDGLTMIVSIVDAGSRFKYVEPVADAKATAVLPVLLRWCTLYGTPKTVQSDNGMCFIADIFRAFCKIMNITHRLSKPYHPESNGKVERPNQQLKHAIRVFGISDPASAKAAGQQNWPEALFRYQARCNHMFNRSIGMAPITAFFGRETSLPIDAAMKNTRYSAPSLFLSKGGWEAFLAHIRAIHAKVYENSRLAQERAKLDHDKGRTDPDFQPGDYVITIDPKAPTSRPAWKGPYKVLEKGSNATSYRVQHLIRHEDISEIHAQRLRLFDASRLTESDLRDLVNLGDNEHFVESIREVVVQSNGQAFTLVKWRYDDVPTWENVAAMRENGHFQKFIAARGYELKYEHGGWKLAKFIDNSVSSSAATALSSSSSSK